MKKKPNCTAITVIRRDDEDYISLIDMLRAKDGEFFISDWLWNRKTVEFLSIWDTVHNPDFNSGEFAIIKSHAGLNSYKLSVKEWFEKTNAIGLRATAGRYGGTYVHHDIAFEFGMWISPKFKIYLIKEFQRIKEDENRRFSLAWNLNRTLAKINYRLEDRQSFAASKRLALRDLFRTLLHELMTAKTRVHEFTFPATAGNS